MATIAIWQDSRGRGACRSCGRSIEWAMMATSGKKMPFDVPITVDHVTERDGRLVEHVDPTISTSHFATCPDAVTWRTKRGAAGR